MLKLFLDGGAGANYYRSTLRAATIRLEVVKLFLDRGADVNAQGGYHGSVLQAAVFWGHLDIVQLLLDNGADIHARGSKYENVLDAAIASWNRREDIVKLLESRGATRCEGHNSTDDSSHPTEVPDPLELEDSTNQQSALQYSVGNISLEETKAENHEEPSSAQLPRPYEWPTNTTSHSFSLPFCTSVLVLILVVGAVFAIRRS